LQSPILRGFIIACLAISTAGSLKAACGPQVYNGRSGNEFWLLELTAGLVCSDADSTPKRTPVLAISVDGNRAFRRWLPEKSLAIVPGSGAELWLAMRTDGTGAKVWAVAEKGGVTAGSTATLAAPFNPFAYSWSHDKRGPWLFFEGSANGTEKLAAYTQDGGVWVLREVVDAPLSPPQYDPKTDATLIGEWRFSRDAVARRIAVPEVTGRRGGRLVPDLIPTRTGDLVAHASERLWVSRDGGGTWSKLDTPWSPSNDEYLQRVPAEQRIIYTWRDSDGHQIVSEWSGEWNTLSTTPEYASYVFVAGDRVIQVRGCASQNAVDITTIENGRTVVKQVPVLEAP
jgi:hypothetical protein